MVVASPDWKSKYAQEWPHSVLREQVAMEWLRLLYIEDLTPCGNGTLIGGRVPNYHCDVSDRYDFYSPSLDCFFEVTGTEWTKRNSAERYQNPILAVLKKKVDDAFLYGVEDKLWFIAIAEIQGEIRFLKCSDAPKYPYVNYAEGEGVYYGIPWMHWLPPFRFQVEVLKR